MKLPYWTYKGKEIASLSSIPDSADGFIYEITYADNTKYIGKKSLYSVRNMKVLKSGKNREGSIGVLRKNTGNGYREYYEQVRKESNWLNYTGSHHTAKDKIITSREILEYAVDKRELTYLEAKWLFIKDVLRNEAYLNDNILGKFYRGRF